ncbi:MAG: preprotein translocase subunit YajC [Planctomycetota bacterium]|nr:preprotein translocase subunit YajC [Planctomycetota bacterium]
MNSMTIRVAMILAVVVALTAGGAWAQTTQPAPAAADEPAVKPFGTPAAPEKAPATPAGEKKGDDAKKTPESGPASRPANPGPCGMLGDNGGLFAIMGGVLVLFWFMGRGKRKQEASRRDMLANLKKGDKITTIGGIIGTIVDVREDEVVLKIDDDARIHMARWAIRGVGETAKAENPDQAKKEQDKK